MKFGREIDTYISIESIGPNNPIYVGEFDSDEIMKVARSQIPKGTEPHLHIVNEVNQYTVYLVGYWK